MVSVVAASPHVVCLAVAPQRFSHGIDALTLRLFNKLRPQHSATSLLAAQLASVEAREALLARCREAILEATKWKAVPPTLRRGELPPPPKKWKSPSLVSASGGNMHLLALSSFALPAVTCPPSDNHYACTKLPLSQTHFQTQAPDEISASADELRERRLAAQEAAASAAAYSKAAATVGVKSGVVVTRPTSASPRPPSREAEAAKANLPGGLTVNMLQSLMPKSLQRSDSMATFMQARHTQPCPACARLPTTTTRGLPSATPYTCACD